MDSRLLPLCFRPPGPGLQWLSGGCWVCSQTGRAPSPSRLTRISTHPGTSGGREPPIHPPTSRHTRHTRLHAYPRQGHIKCVCHPPTHPPANCPPRTKQLPTTQHPSAHQPHHAGSCLICAYSLTSGSYVSKSSWYCGGMTASSVCCWGRGGGSTVGPCKGKKSQRVDLVRLQ